MSSSTTTARMAGPWVEQDRSKLQPLPLVDEFDDRPATKDVIDQHISMIEKVRCNLKSDPLFDPIKHDDLWIVRYILSCKAADKATEAAKAFLLYRKERNLDAIDIRSSPPGLDCEDAGVRKYYGHIKRGAMTFSQPDPDRGVALFVHLGGLDQNKIATISDDEDPFWYFMEWMFQVLDSVTRRTGRLTKGVRFIDLEGYSVSQNNRECINRNSKNARDCQSYYPQMLASVYVLNAPSWGIMVLRTVKPLLPKRFADQFDIVNPAKSRKDTRGLFKHMSARHLPMKLHGDLNQRPRATGVSLYRGRMCSI